MALLLRPEGGSGCHILSFTTYPMAPMTTSFLLDSRPITRQTKGDILKPIPNKASDRALSTALNGLVLTNSLTDFNELSPVGLRAAIDKVLPISERRQAVSMWAVEDLRQCATYTKKS
jgi:hypothetical protein